MQIWKLICCTMAARLSHFLRFLLMVSDVGGLDDLVAANLALFSLRGQSDQMGCIAN